MHPPALFSELLLLMMRTPFVRVGSCSPSCEGVSMLGLLENCICTKFASQFRNLTAASTFLKSDPELVERMVS